jgi:hypothetical protein
MIFGKQIRHCPNCGQKLYDSNVQMVNVQSLMCGKECRDEWEMKYARSILGKDGSPEPVAPSNRVEKWEV